MSIRLNSPSIEPWITRETESNSALRWTGVDGAERREEDRRAKRKEKERNPDRDTQRDGEGERRMMMMKEKEGRIESIRKKQTEIRQRRTGRKSEKY